MIVKDLINKTMKVSKALRAKCGLEGEIMRTLVNIARNMMFRYSAIKIRTKRTLPYSVLNPDTNSLSLSAKSNGARFVSARVVVSHISRIGSMRMMVVPPQPLSVRLLRSQDLEIRRRLRRMRTKLIS